MQWAVFGDLDFLAVILNAIAAMFTPFRDAGVANNAYSGLVSAAALIGVLLVLVQFVVTGSGNPLRRLFVSLAFFLVAFAPATSVTMVSTYTGASRTVDNVPVSIAFTGMFFSKIGSGMTALFEQAYAVPSTRPNGFVDALHAYRTLRAVTAAPVAWTAANDAGGGDFEGSWKNYIAECVARAIESGQLSVATVREAVPIHAGLNVTNETMTTLINIDGAWSLHSCKEAYPLLVIWSETTVVPAVRGILQDYFSKPGSIVANPFSQRLAEMQTALRMGGIGENDLVFSFLLSHLYEEGIAQRHILDGRTTYAQVIHDAMRQRNVQWSAQGDLFSHYAQPVMTFIEGFFYAASPLVLVILVVAVNGYGALTKFLMLGIWIQFWFPIASIVHLFSYLSVESAMSDIIAAGVPPASFAGIALSDGIVGKWLSVSGLFAASVPMLALFLITGSVYAFQGIASSIGGPDTVTEKNAEPDSYGAAPVTQGLPRFEESQLRGRASPGAVETLPVYALSHDRSGTVREAERRSEGAREAFVHALGQVFTTGAGSRSSAEAQASLRQAISAENSNTESYLRNQGAGFVRTFAERNGITEDAARQLIGNVGLGLKLGGLAGPQANLGGTGSHTSSENISIGRANELVDKMQEELSVNQGLSSNLTEAIARDVLTSNQNSRYAFADGTQSNELRESAERYLSAEQSHEQAVSDQVSQGAQQRLDTPFLSRQIASDGRQYENFARLLAQHRLLGEVTRLGNRWITAGHFDSDADGRRQAFVGAGLAVLDRAGRSEDLANVLRPWGLHVPDIGAPETPAGPSPVAPEGTLGLATAEQHAAWGENGALRSNPALPEAPPVPAAPVGPDVHDVDAENLLNFPGYEKLGEFQAERSRDRVAAIRREEPSLAHELGVGIDRLDSTGILPGSAANRYDYARALGLSEPQARLYREAFVDPGSQAAADARDDLRNGAPRTAEGAARVEEQIAIIEQAAQLRVDSAEPNLRAARALSDRP